MSESDANIKQSILVLSGKGGVGKSTVAANLAVALARSGAQTGILDVDIHGPSIPHLLGLSTAAVTAVAGPDERPQISPIVRGNLKAISIGFMMPNRDDAVIWRGPMKYNVIKQFIEDVEWGSLDYLVVDAPPGTGDEPLSVVQLLRGSRGAVIVTTPQEVALNDVRRCAMFCRQVEVPVWGVIENMSGFVCPHCGETTDVFKRGGAEQMAKDQGFPFLGRVPLDARVVEACDDGQPLSEAAPGTPTAESFSQILQNLKPTLEA